MLADRHPGRIMTDTPTRADDRPDIVLLSEVTKRFGSGAPALDGVSAAIRGGEITGLVGPDGAGKTTLIRLMTGLLVPEAGKLTVLGFDTVTEAASIQAVIGYMPQRFGLYEDLTIRENLDLYADLRGLPKAERPAVYDELLAFTDLGRFTARLAGKLSGGMKQKLGLACALLKKPRLLLLDEPSVGVDPISRRELWKMVEDLAREGIGVVWSTAYLDEAERCDRVLLLNEGKPMFAGPPAELTARVAGRVWRLTGTTGRKREVLARALDRAGVVDGVIQGDAIRLVLAGGHRSRAGDTGRGRGRGGDAAGSAAVRGRLRRHARRRPGGALGAGRGRAHPAGRWRQAGDRGARADQALRRLHRRGRHHLRRSPRARSSACSVPTARASPPPSRCCAAS